MAPLAKKVSDLCFKASLAVADPDQAFGRGSQIRGRQKVLTCLNTPASPQQSLSITQKWLPFLGQENGYFCCLNYAIFQGITTV